MHAVSEDGWSKDTRQICETKVHQTLQSLMHLCVPYYSVSVMTVLRCDLVSWIERMSNKMHLQLHLTSQDELFILRYGTLQLLRSNLFLTCTCISNRGHYYVNRRVWQIDCGIICGMSIIFLQFDNLSTDNLFRSLEPFIILIINDNQSIDKEKQPNQIIF